MRHYQLSDFFYIFFKLLFKKYSETDSRRIYYSRGFHMNKVYDENYKGPLLKPISDPIFKILFTDPSPEANHALTSFLSTVLGKPVCDVQIVSNEVPKESISDKAAIFDVTCHFEGDNEVLEIEMQGKDDHNSYDNRAEYYAAHLLNHYTKCGEGWIDVPKAYQISVLNFIYDKNDDSGFSHYVMRKESGGTLNQRLNIFFIELPKFEVYEEVDVNSLTSMQKWSTFFLYAGESDEQDFVTKLAESEAGIMEAMKVLGKISQDEINWQRERDYFDQQMTLKTIKRYARETGYAEGLEMGKIDGHKQGLAEGREEGRAEGIAEGRAEGIAEGKAAGLIEGKLNTQLDLITKKLHKGKSVEQIADELEDSIENIQNIILQNNLL